METLVETVSEHIFWKNKDLAEETRSANLAVAAFVKVGKITFKMFRACVMDLNYKLKGRFLQEARHSFTIVT